MIRLEERAQKLWSRDFIILMGSCGGVAFCNYFLVATLPIYAQNLTGTNVYAGLMTTVYTLAALATRPITGALADKVGRVKLLIIGAALCAVACLLYRFAAGILILIIVRSLQGVGFGVHTTAGGAAAADIIPKSRRAEGIGIFGLYATIATAVAPAIALSIIGTGVANENFLPLFTLTTVIGVVCVLLDCLIRFERVQKADAKIESVPAQDVPRGGEDPLPKTYLGFEKGVFIPAAVLVLTFIAISSVTSFLTLFARDRQLGGIGLFFTIIAVGMFCSRIFLGKIADRRGADVVIIPALCALIPCFALIPFVDSRIYLFIIALPLGLAQGAICPAVNSMMFGRCSVKRRGSASAAYFAAIDLGYCVGALMYGFIAEYLSYSFVYWTAMIFAIAATAVYLLYLRNKKTKETAPV